MKVEATTFSYASVVNTSDNDNYMNMGSSLGTRVRMALSNNIVNDSTYTITAAHAANQWKYHTFTFS